MKIGAISVPINYRLAANEVKYILDNSRAKVLMFEEAFRAPVETIKDRIAVEKLVYVGAKPADREISFEDFIAPGAKRSPRRTSAGTTQALLCTPPAPPVGRRAWCARIWLTS